MSNVPDTSPGNGKWWAGFAAAFAATYVVHHLEVDYGLDFKKFGMEPAVFKGLTEGSFVSFFVWITPSHVVQSVTDIILFIKAAFRQWRDAIHNPNQEPPK